MESEGHWVIIDPIEHCSCQFKGTYIGLLENLFFRFYRKQEQRKVEVRRINNEILSPHKMLTVDELPYVIFEIKPENQAIN